MIAILDLPEVRARIQRFTVADYERPAEGREVSQRAELIRGLIIEKTPKSPLHAYLTKRVYDLCQRVVRRGFIVRQENPLRLADSMPEPDISVVHGVERDFLARHPTTAELVVEMAVSSAALDRENASLYAEAGMTEYWIVLGSEEQVEVYREPVDGSYQSRRVYGRGETIEGVTVVDVPVPVAALFGQLPCFDVTSTASAVATATIQPFPRGITPRIDRYFPAGKSIFQAAGRIGTSFWATPASIFRA